MSTTSRRRTSSERPGAAPGAGAAAGRGAGPGGLALGRGAAHHRCGCFGAAPGGRPRAAGGRRARRHPDAPGGRLAGALRHHHGGGPLQCHPHRARRRPRGGRHALLHGHHRQGTRALRLLPLDDGAAGRRVRHVPDRRPVQPLCLVRGAAHRLVRPAGARRRARPAGGRAQVRGPQPRRLGHAAGDHRGRLWPHRHGQPGRPLAALRARSSRMGWWRRSRRCCWWPSGSRPRWCRCSSGCRPRITPRRSRSRPSSADCSRRSASTRWCACSRCSSPTRRPTSRRCC